VPLVEEEDPLAFVVGTVELISLLAERLGAADRAPWSWLAAVDLNTIGIVIVVTFLVTWIGAVTLWKVRRYDERYPVGAGAKPEPAQA
jgi:high-affinity nickel-transport protein